MKNIGYFILAIFIILTLYVFCYSFINKNVYRKMLNEKTMLIIEGKNAPRGRIYDINGKVLVDNKTINNLVFHYMKGMNILDITKKLSYFVMFDSANDDELIKYYKALYDETKLITEKEKKLYNQRKLNNDKLNKIIDSKILDIVKSFTISEINESKIYSLLSDGYLYDTKIILENIDDNLINKIVNANIPGILIESSFVRYYPYGDVLKNIFGNVGKITKEDKDEYLDLGYRLNDEVGISYLEKYYDNYLQGKKAIYKVNNDYSLTLLENEQRGNDLYLSIDIDLQLKCEEIVKNRLIKSKNYPNTKYLTDTYVIVSNPKTGFINAIVGKRLLENNEFNDIVINNISSSFTMGSVVKGASISVGYKYDLINKGKKILDGCVKLKNLTEKCSFKKLGYLDEISALKYSSNYYQFLIAINLAGYAYKWNMNLNITNKEFDIYRKMFSSYGLGIKNGIDLPNEKIGMIGKSITPDLLLNLTIGQYDTYTPLNVSTYINTVASSGERRSPKLLSFIKDINGNVIYKNKGKVIDKVDIKSEDISKIQQGFYEVMHGGTGTNSLNKVKDAAGKTGTSESFLDTNNDGIIDTETISLSLVNYFPYSDPMYSLTIISPHASYNNQENIYTHHITYGISREITDFIFENMRIS